MAPPTTEEARRFLAAFAAAVTRPPRREKPPPLPLPEQQQQQQQQQGKATAEHAKPARTPSSPAGFPPLHKASSPIKEGFPPLRKGSSPKKEDFPPLQRRRSPNKNNNAPPLRKPASPNKTDFPTLQKPTSPTRKTDNPLLRKPASPTKRTNFPPLQQPASPTRNPVFPPLNVQEPASPTNKTDSSLLQELASPTTKTDLPPLHEPSSPAKTASPIKTNLPLLQDPSSPTKTVSSSPQEPASPTKTLIASPEQTNAPLRSSNQADNSPPAETAETAEPPSPLPPPPPDPNAVSAAAAFHALCVLALPRLPLSPFSHLLHALTLTHPPSPCASFPPPIPARTELPAYARLVLARLRARLALPHPVLLALDQSDAPSPPFPAVSSPPWGAAHSSQGIPAPKLPARLSANLEQAWDDLLVLYRRFRGDILPAAPRVLDAAAAVRLIVALHPAAVDLFAARLLAVLVDAARAPEDPKMHSLSARLTTAAGTQLAARRGKAAPRKEQKPAKGVVLHRLPLAVRHSFAADLSLHFVLEFLTAVDSARLNCALTPRVAARVKLALAMAAAATSNDAFTDAVVEARMCARVLAVCLCAPNWPHSRHAVEGAAGGGRRGLEDSGVAGRVPLCSASWAAALDLAAVVHSAVQSGQTLAVVAVVAVADVVLRLAAVDPVATETQWYRSAVEAVNKVYVRSENEDAGGSKDEDGEMRDRTSMPLLDVIIHGLWESEVRIPRQAEDGDGGEQTVPSDQETWPAIGDVRFIRECCPVLDEMRQRLISAQLAGDRAKTETRRITPMPAGARGAQSALGRTPVLPKVAVPTTAAAKPPVANRAGEDANKADETKSILQREFCARMDGRLRELMRVVVTCRPSSQEAAREKYTRVVEMLYPNTPVTVVAVAAGICASQVGRRTGIEKKDSEGSMTRKEMLEARLSQPVSKGEKEGGEKEEEKKRRHEVAIIEAAPKEEEAKQAQEDSGVEAEPGKGEQRQPQGAEVDAMSEEEEAKRRQAVGAVASTLDEEEVRRRQEVIMIEAAPV